jgi:hypothetical protein
VARAVAHVESFEDGDALAVALARRGVQESTLSAYSSNIQPLLAFAKAIRNKNSVLADSVAAVHPQDVTLQEFIAFAEACREQKAGDVARSARVALAEVQRAFGLKEWAREDRTIFLASAAVYDAGEADCNPDNAGTLTDAMLDELLTLCPAAWLHTAVWFIVSLSLRVSQAEAALAGDYDVALRSLQIDREDDKRDKRDTRAPKSHSKTCHDEHAHRLIVSEVTGKAPGEPLLPRKVAHSLRTLMKNAARVFEWPSELDYAGAHVLAHTGVRRLRDKHPLLPWKDFAKMVAKSESMARKYAEPLDQRLARLEKQKRPKNEKSAAVTPTPVTQKRARSPVV